MAQTEKTKVKGRYNSSITRVRPFFKALINIDKTGESWIPKLLRAMPLNKAKSDLMIQGDLTILEDCLKKRKYKDDIIGEIELEECFEVKVPPSRDFLEWALKNTQELSWPDKGEKKYGEDTQFKRERLFGQHGEDHQKEVLKKGLDLLNEKGVAFSSRKWWAFEGFTEMDCLIETESFLIGVEGKRTEFVSESTHWFRDRNQVVRNIEVLANMAKEKKKDFVFILLTEDGVDPIMEAHFRVSLPHNEELVDVLRKHYLGCLSWKDACAVTGLNFNELPNDIYTTNN